MKAEDIRLGKRMFYSHTVDEIVSAVVTKMESLDNGDIRITITDGTTPCYFTVNKDDEIYLKIYDATSEKWGHSCGRCSFSFQKIKEEKIEYIKKRKVECIKEIDDYIAKLESLKEEDL